MRYGLECKQREMAMRFKLFWLTTECMAVVPHVQHKSVEAVNDRPHQLKCLACTDPRMIPKQGRCRTIDVFNEPKLWRLMDAKFPMTTWVVQHRGLKRWNGDVDMTVFVGSLDRKLFVQVDGFSHDSSWRGPLGHTLFQQLHKDQEFNRLAVKAGNRVLRLHPADFAQWEQLLASAMAWDEREVWATVTLSHTVQSVMDWATSCVNLLLTLKRSGRPVVPWQNHHMAIP